MDSEKAKHVGAVVTPQLACVLLANILIKKLGSARTFAEQALFGLKYTTAPGSRELDELVAAHPAGDRANPADLEAFERERLRRISQSLDANNRSIGYAVIDRAVPWGEMVLQPDAELLLVMCLAGALIWVSTSTWECFRGFEPTYHATVMAMVVLVFAIYALSKPIRMVGADMLEGRFAFGFGLTSFVSAFFVLANVYLHSPASYPVANTPLMRDMDTGAVLQYGPQSWLDLGGSLRAGFLDAAGRVGEGIGVGAATATAYADAPIFVICLALSLFLGVLTTLLFLPMLRVGRCYSDLLGGVEAKLTGADAVPAVSNWAFKTALVGWAYAPIVLAAMWTRTMTEKIVSDDLVRCSASELGRDCTPDGTFVGGWKPLVAFIKDSGMVGDAYTILGETDWLRLRLGLVVLYVCSWVFLLRPFLGRYLQTARHVISDTIIAASAKKEAKLKGKEAAASGRKSGFEPEMLSALHENLAIRCMRVVVSSTVMLLQLVAVPALLGSLALLALRLAGMNMGICEGLHAALPAMNKMLAKTPPKPELLVQVAQWALAVLLGRDISKEIAAGRQAVYVLAPAFWRPVLSFTVSWLLLWIFIMSEASFLYWRYLYAGVTEDHRRRLYEQKSEQGAAEEGSKGGKKESKKSK